MGWGGMLCAQKCAGAAGVVVVTGEGVVNLMV